MNPRIGPRRLGWLPLYAGLTTLTCAIYLLASQRAYGLGFPLDDAWIHQTFARNLVHLKEWTFQPGPTSGGSTSPLWTILLALGAALRLDPRLWAFILGAVALFATAVLCWAWLHARLADRKWAWAAGGVALLEWHLAWASLSGMETILESLLVVAVFMFLDRRRTTPFWLGAWIGLGMWIRPDSATLILPLAWVMAWDPTPLRHRVRGVIMAGAGMGILVGPYLVFNRLVGGSWWPTTYYAKQAEYAVLRQAPMASRMLREFTQPLIGVGIILLPGLIVVAWQAIRRRQVGRLAPLMWAGAFISTYAWRLPVTYQHGRYVIPTVPIVLVLGLEGMIAAGPWWARWGRWGWLSRVWPASALGVLIAFWLLGASAYARDVSIIETEMVSASRWIAIHTEPDAVVAAHDIGALGYFGGREVLDLAGLVSPEVIPILRDEPSLAVYLDRNGADYLMTFPGWYPELTRWAQPVFQTAAPYSPAAGGENMVVYRWEPVEFASLDMTMLYSPHSIGGRLDHGDDSGHHR